MSLFTECGVLHVANEIGDFKSMMSNSMEGDVVRRDWHAQVRAKLAAGQHNPTESLATFRRVADALHGRPRKPGIDVISRAGTITVTPVGVAKR